MYLHIGDSKVVALDDIIGVFNMQLKENQVNAKFLDGSPHDKPVKKEEEACNSFIVTNKKVYYSHIAPLTLQKRIEHKWE